MDLNIIKWQKSAHFCDRALIFCIQNNVKVKVIDSITQMLMFSFYVSEIRLFENN